MNFFKTLHGFFRKPDFNSREQSRINTPSTYTSTQVERSTLPPVNPMPKDPEPLKKEIKPRQWQKEYVPPVVKVKR